MTLIGTMTRISNVMFTPRYEFLMKKFQPDNTSENCVLEHIELIKEEILEIIDIERSLDNEGLVCDGVHTRRLSYEGQIKFLLSVILEIRQCEVKRREVSEIKKDKMVLQDLNKMLRNACIRSYICGIISGAILHTVLSSFN